MSYGLIGAPAVLAPLSRQLPRKALFPISGISDRGHGMEKKSGMSKSKSSKGALTKEERRIERENIEPQRFALIFDPPTVVLEYRDKRKKSLRHRKMQIPTGCLHDIDKAVEKLVKHNNIHLHASVVSSEQIQRLVSKLIGTIDTKQSTGERSSAGGSMQAGLLPGIVKPSPATQQVPPAPLASTFSSHVKPMQSTAPRDTASELFSPLGVTSTKGKAQGGDESFSEDPYAIHLDKADVLQGRVDLNKVTESELEAAKELMNEDFEKTALKPGDDGFVYDKRMKFETVGGLGEWDNTDSDTDGDEDRVSPGVDRGIGSPGVHREEDDGMYNFS